MIDIVKFVDQCYNKLPASLKNCPWVATDHGRALLQTEEQLDAYLAAYGEMHIVKCRAALQNFPFEELIMNFEVFDWGCGQGLASLTFLEFLRERGMLGKLNGITLIEPSKIALQRAKTWVEQNAGPGVHVTSVNELIPNDNNVRLDQVKCNSQISINLFSNILDIRSLSLSWLAHKTSSMANINYMVCVGPKFSENTRIQDFCGYFNPQHYFSDIKSYRYAYTTHTHHPYSCETKCFVHNRRDEIINEYVEHAHDSIITDDYDYAIECMRGIVNDETLSFYNRIRNECSNAFTIFIRPFIGTDNPDIVLANISRGIILINVCDDINKLESAINKVENIKSYIFNTHLKSIKIDSIINSSVYGCVKTALFFPHSTQLEVEERLKKLNDERNERSRNENDKDYYEYLIKLYPNDDLSNKLNSVTSRGFRYDYYDELLKIITGHWHSYIEGDTNFNLSDRQKEIVRSNNLRLRVKGVAGCGKTQVIANRAVEQHLKTGDKVLIITFNISLIQYVRMRIHQVPADFSTNMFEITNYHQFFLSMANRYSEKRISLSDFDDPDFFAPYSNKTEKFKTILIDEVQDFKSEWISSLINYFLAPEGSVSVFGDGEQNIFERSVEQDTKMPSIPTFTGRWNEMSERISMRIINPNIAALSYEFAKVFVDETLLPLNAQNQLLFETYWIKYWNVGKDKNAYALTQNILWILQEYKIEPRNAVIMSESINLLRDVEKNYLQLSHNRTLTNFETAEQYEKLCKNQKSPTLFQKDLKEIRRAAKTHFTTDSDSIKLSTIHSFKGWESESVILLLQPEMKINESYDGYCIQERENTPALIYTALTRAKCNLFILNLGNEKYHSFFKSNII